MITTKTQRDMETTRKQIEVTKEVRKEIKAAFKCSDVAIWRALSYALDTPLSKRIRKFARLKGGVLLLLTPAMETIHDKDGFMRQYFENGAMIEVNKKLGILWVFDKDGKVCRKIMDCTIPQLYEMQGVAANL